MSVIALFTLLSLAIVTIVGAQGLDEPLSTFPATPLVSKHFPYPTGIPEQADQDNLLRGTQFGYNICNSTTENQNSLCQTSFLNSLDDFCLWAPSKPNSTIPNTEGQEVAWCTKPGHGTRLIPAGAIQGIQFMRTPDYVQVVGFIDQTYINIQSGDDGGELDPHGDDHRGNPLGGLMYSTAWSSDNNTYQQVEEWTNFMGGNAFCFKACDPAGANAANYCQHTLDRIGCLYNMPNNAQNGTFEACEGDSQDFPGVYTGTDGAVTTYSQPPESLGPIPQLTWTPRLPSSSNCVTYTSSSLFAAITTASSQPTAASGSMTGTSGVVKPTAESGTGTATGSAAGASKTSNDATALAVPGVGVLGVFFSVLLLS